MSDVDVIADSIIRSVAWYIADSTDSTVIYNSDSNVISTAYSAVYSPTRFATADTTSNAIEKELENV